jgi:hypothetical protein
VILVPGLAGFPYPPSPGSYSDISITHYPNALFLRNTIFQEHTIPLWSPTILSGYPFNANPLSGLWYPPGWLAILLPLPLAFNVSSFLHLLWGGVGMVLLLRDEKVSAFPALFGAVSFMAMPKLFAHYGAGHLTLLYAIAWTPWLLYISRKFYFSNHSSKSPLWRRLLSQPSLVWALILLADVRWAAFAGLLWWYTMLFHKRNEGVRYSNTRFIGSLFVQTLIGVLLAAPLIIPLVEYVNLSTRANMSAQDVFIFSLPPVKLLGLFFPDFGGFYEWVVYSGALVILFVAVGFARSRQTPATKCWMGAILISLLFALGSNIPYFESLAGLPGLNLLRVPSRMIFITGLSLAALAAHQLQWLISGVNPIELRRSRLIQAGLLAFVLLLTAGAWVVTGKPPAQFIWGSIFMLAGALLLILLQEKRLNITTWQFVLLSVLLVDLCGVDRTLFTIRSAQTVLAESEQAARYLTEQPGEFRVYSPTYSLPQQTAAHYELELASGVDPLQLQSYADFMQAASGVPNPGYSVVLPPMVSDGQFPDAAYKPNAKMLGLLNVGYILTDYPMQADGLDPEAVFNNIFLYKNRYVMPRAWVGSGADRMAARVLDNTPNYFRISAAGPGLLSLSEINYPGWKAWVDGKPVAVIETAGLLRGVGLDSGEHEVEFRYFPLSLVLGLVLIVLSIPLVVIAGRGRS